MDSKKFIPKEYHIKSTSGTKEKKNEVIVPTPKRPKKAEKELYEKPKIEKAEGPSFLEIAKGLKKLGIEYPKNLEYIHKIFEEHDKFTFSEHSKNMREPFYLMIKELPSVLKDKRGDPLIGDQQRELANQIVLLHDMGKTQVPAELIRLKRKLTDKEFEKMRSHVDPKFLDEAGGLLGLPQEIIEAAKFHHERYDGKGYPSGRKGEEIPLNSICY